MYLLQSSMETFASCKVFPSQTFGLAFVVQSSSAAVFVSYVDLIGTLGLNQGIQNSGSLTRQHHHGGTFTAHQFSLIRYHNVKTSGTLPRFLAKWIQGWEEGVPCLSK